MSYVDGFVLPIPTKSLPAYRRIAKLASKAWLEHGALQYHEAAGDDLKTTMGVSFPKLAKIGKGETVVFAWITYKSRKHRDAVNAKVMKDPRLAKMMKVKDLPFDCNRMSYGGFKTLVKA